MGIILDVQISFILVSESIKLHLQRRNSGVAMNQKKNDIYGAIWTDMWQKDSKDKEATLI